MRKIHLFISALVCGVVLLALGSCSKDKEAETRIADHVEYTKLSFEAKDDLREVCSEIKVSVMLSEGNWWYTTLSEENNYKFEKSFKNSTIPASGGYAVRFKLKDLSELPLVEYKLTYQNSGSFTVYDTQGEVMDQMTVDRFSTSAVIKRHDLRQSINLLNEEMNFFYKCDARGFLMQTQPEVN